MYLFNKYIYLINYINKLLRLTVKCKFRFKNQKNYYNSKYLIICLDRA